MNLGELRTAIQQKGYGTDTATAQTGLINSIYRRIGGEHRWPWLEAQNTSITTTAGDPDYSLAAITDLAHIDAVRVHRGTEYPQLSYIAPQDLRDMEHVDRDNGTPRFWTYVNAQLRLWPAPDAAYTVTIDYLKRPTVLSADGDTPIFDSTYHDVLVWGAVAELAFRERDWSAKNFADAEFNLRYNEMKRSYGLKQRQNATHVKRSSFWDHVGRNDFWTL